MFGGSHKNFSILTCLWLKKTQNNQTKISIRDIVKVNSVRNIIPCGLFLFGFPLPSFFTIHSFSFCVFYFFLLFDANLQVLSLSCINFSHSGAFFFLSQFMFSLWPSLVFTYLLFFFHFHLNFINSLFHPLFIRDSIE